MTENTKPVLGYWDTRGRGEPIRLLLEYAGVEYENKRLGLKVGKIVSEEWTGVIMPSLNADFPNLPYYKERNLVLTESSAILKFLARKHGLAPTADPELAMCEMIDEIILETRLDLVKLLYIPYNYEVNKKRFTEKTVEKLKQLDTFIKNKKFLTGEKLYYTDLLFFETIDILMLYDKEMLSGMEYIIRIFEKIKDQERIKNYRNSPRFKEYPIVNWFTHWGYIKERDQSGISEPFQPYSTWKFR